MTRAVILAAGRGSRMGAQTEKKPKCLTVLKGKTLLEWQLESLSKGGIENIKIVTGYKSELLQPFVSQTYLNSDWAKTNMVSSLFCIPRIDGSTIISYSDITYSHRHVVALKNSKHDIVITADMDWLELWSLRFADPLDDAESFTSEGNTLITIGEKSDDLDKINAQFMGLLKLTPKGWSTLKNIFLEFSEEQQSKMDMTSLLRHSLAKNVSIKIEFVRGKWCECDTYDDVLKYETVLADNKSWLHDWRD